MLALIIKIGESAEQADAMQFLTTIDEWYGRRFGWLLGILIGGAALIPLIIIFLQNRIISAKKAQLETDIDDKIKAAEENLSKRTRLLEKRLDSTQAEMWYEKGEACRRDGKVQTAVRFFRSTLRKAVAGENAAYAERAATRLGELLAAKPEHEDLKLDIVRQHILEARQAFSQIGSVYAQTLLDEAINSVAESMNRTLDEYLDYSKPLETPEQE